MAEWVTPRQGRPAGDLTRRPTGADVLTPTARTGAPGPLRRRRGGRWDGGDRRPVRCVDAGPRAQRLHGGMVTGGMIGRFCGLSIGGSQRHSIPMRLGHEVVGCAARSRRCLSVGHPQHEGRPYDSATLKLVLNVQVVGRCISTSPAAHTSTRVMGTGMSMGEARVARQLQGCGVTRSRPQCAMST